MAIDAKQWLTDAAKEAGLSEDETKALLSVTANDKFSKKVAEGVMLRSDYSRNLNELATERQKAEKLYADNLKWYNDEKAKAEAAAANGNDNRNSVVNLDPKDFVSRADFNAAVKEAAESAFQRSVGANVAITKEAIRAASDYSRRFGKDLDLDGLEKFALENNMPLKTAYPEFIKAEAEAKAKVDEEKRIKEAVDAGVSAELSKRNLPIESAASEPHVLFDRIKTPDAPILDEKTRTSAFVDEWNKAASAH